MKEIDYKYPTLEGFVNSHYGEEEILVVTDPDILENEVFSPEFTINGDMRTLAYLQEKWWKGKVIGWYVDDEPRIRVAVEPWRE